MSLRETGNLPGSKQSSTYTVEIASSQEPLLAMTFRIEFDLYALIFRILCNQFVPGQFQKHFFQCRFVPIAWDKLLKRFRGV
jgi:hypothetical protein